MFANTQIYKVKLSEEYLTQIWFDIQTGLTEIRFSFHPMQASIISLVNSAILKHQH